MRSFQRGFTAPCRASLGLLHHPNSKAAAVELKLDRYSSSSKAAPVELKLDRYSSSSKAAAVELKLDRYSSSSKAAASTATIVTVKGRRAALGGK